MLLVSPSLGEYLELFLKARHLRLFLYWSTQSSNGNPHISSCYFSISTSQQLIQSTVDEHILGLQNDAIYYITLRNLCGSTNSKELVCQVLKYAQISSNTPYTYMLY